MEKREHEFCLRCGRRLRSAEARSVGYGAICRKKVIAAGRKLFDDNCVDCAKNSDNSRKF